MLGRPTDAGPPAGLLAAGSFPRCLRRHKQGVTGGPAPHRAGLPPRRNLTEGRLHRVSVARWLRENQPRARVLQSVTMPTRQPAGRKTDVLGRPGGHGRAGSAAAPRPARPDAPDHLPAHPPALARPASSGAGTPRLIRRWHAPPHPALATSWQSNKPPSGSGSWCISALLWRESTRRMPRGPWPGTGKWARLTPPNKSHSRRDYDSERTVVTPHSGVSPRSVRDLYALSPASTAGCGTQLRPGPAVAAWRAMITRAGQLRFRGWWRPSLRRRPAGYWGERIAVMMRWPGSVRGRGGR